MNNEDNCKQEIEALRQRFKALLSSDSLSDDEKQKLSQEMLKIIYQSSEEVTQ